ISIIEFLASPTPFFLTCPKCSVKLQVKGFLLALLTLGTVFGTVVYGVVNSFNGLPVLGILIVAVFVLELLACFWVLNMGTLIVSEKLTRSKAH
ncbi:MAG TPA: hypothetical protein VNU93_05920, partial [Verrucomicrobiae bacterium]|nr:hypothetical protein [Verrucomicrobiae bacterium]